MNNFLKEIFNFLGSPVIYFTLAILAWVAIMKYYHIWTQPKFIKTVLVTSIVTLGWALFDENFRHEALKPDNVPIWFMMGSVGFFVWLSFRG